VKEGRHPELAHRMHHGAVDRSHGRPRSGWVALGVLAFLVAIVLVWVLSFLLTSWLYTRLSLHPAEVVRQVVTAFTGLVLLAIPAAIIGNIQQPREQAIFRSLLAAIGRIAQGDFRTRVETQFPDSDHPFTQLVHSINDMAADLARMEALRQEFISNVSHEIQSPLTSIGGFAKALQDESLSSDQRRRYLEIIGAESERLSKLSDNLMRLTALEAEQPPLDPRPYRLDAQLRRVILAAEPQWAGKAIEMELEAAPLTVVADEALMEHVFANLLHNAVKFTPKGGTIRVRAVSDAGVWTVEVEDSGVGIPPEDQERIFERFFKGDRSRDRSQGGSGLGLALARKIVALHGGDIGVSSAAGTGATFRVELPLHGIGSADPR